MRAAFPDLRYDIEQIVEGANTVAVHLTVTGTHLGDFFGTPPSGRSFRVMQINIERIAGGKIVAHRRLTDELSLLRQIGAIGS
jgi:predicted ester cyclase